MSVQEEVHPYSPSMEYDNPWKEILDDFLQAFLEFCLPELAAEIDWSHDYVKDDGRP